MIDSWTFSPDDGVPPPVAPFAHATATGRTLHLTGQMPTGLDGALVDGGIVEQTDRVLANLARVLALLGGGLADVVSARAYLRRWEHYPQFNAAYERWFPGRLPSRTCVGVSGLALDALVEIDMVAWRAEGWHADGLGGAPA
jgi:2-iminobutanoate/2-iminopropanoate deaminase